MNDLRTLINFTITVYEDINSNDENIDKFSELLENFHLKDWNACIEILKEFKEMDEEIC